MDTLWRCDDEEEAYGVELLLTRAGVATQVRDEGETITFVGDAQARKRAEQLESRIAQHFAHSHDRALKARLDARDRLVRRMLYGCAAAVALWLLWLA